MSPVSRMAPLSTRSLTRPNSSALSIGREVRTLGDPPLNQNLTKVTPPLGVTLVKSYKHKPSVVLSEKFTENEVARGVP